MARTIDQGGRAKAYRPLPAETRQAAVEAGLAAYDQGDFFEAHELLEPAWMGTRDLAERELLQGVIKLAAAFVHGARSNPAGVAKNLRGARDRLVAGTGAAGVVGVDVEALVTAIDRRLAGSISLDDPPIAIGRLPEDPWRAGLAGPTSRVAASRLGRLRRLGDARRSRQAPISGRWLNAQPTMTRITKLPVPTPAAAR